MFNMVEKVSHELLPDGVISICAAVNRKSIFLKEPLQLICSV